MIKKNWKFRSIVYSPILLVFVFLVYKVTLNHDVIFFPFSPHQDEDRWIGQSDNKKERQQESTQLDENATGNLVYTNPNEKIIIHETIEKSHQTSCQVTLVIILCNNGPRKNLKVHTKNESNSVLNTSNNHQSRPKTTANNFERQIQQTIVLLKSMVIQQKFNPFDDSNQCVNVLVVSDEKENLLWIQRIIIQEEKWSPDFVNLLNFTFVPVQYPRGSQWMKQLFRPCATLRLFLAELLPNYDSVIYLDTDIILFRNLKTLWNEFRSFDSNDKLIAGMSECLYHYNTKQVKIPFYGKTGLNAGIALMSLARMRNSSWTNKIGVVTKNHKNLIRLADQDILNIYFHSHPDELHQLTCDWNFRPFQCRLGSFCQDLTLTKGISALHGNALSFTPQGPEPLFYSVFSTFQHLNLTQSDPSIVQHLLHTLESHLTITSERRVSNPSKISDCMRYGAFKILLLTELDKITRKYKSKSDI